MYNNQHGRFTAVDPLLASGRSADPQSFNRYAYSRNDPENLTDPSGLDYGAFSFADDGGTWDFKKFDIPEGKNLALSSTHTDKDGRVYLVQDDGDLGVYRHYDIDASSGSPEVVTCCKRG